MATYLDAILAHHREEHLTRRPDLGLLAEQAMDCPPTRDFAGALRSRAAEAGIAIIAEIKRRSPSKGDLSVDLDPAKLARSLTNEQRDRILWRNAAELYGIEIPAPAASR